MVASTLEQELIGESWAALTGTSEPSVLADLVDVDGPGHLPSRFPVDATAVASVVTALMAGIALHRHRGGGPLRARVARGHVFDAVRSERFFRVRSQPAGASFAPLSRFWPTADGWVRTHANYPWHRAALLTVLRTSDDPVPVAAALAGRRAHDVEEEIVAAGGVAAAVRPLGVWRDHGQGRALAAEPLISHRAIGDAPPRVAPAGGLPAQGVRVLDLTRVIAGPVSTRYLAALGADVLRLDPPHHADMARATAADTLLGKRSSLLDLRDRQGEATLHGLLDGADVVVCGYRPGALDRFGLGEAQLAERHPGLVVVYLAAWGHTGLWAQRRGFDSVVQAATGIAEGEAASADGPGALPCQLLDHGTGYLAAAAALDGLRRQRSEGGTHVRRLSLARTASWLTSRGPDAEADDGDGTIPNSHEWLAELDGPRGPITAVLPPGTLDERPLLWPGPITRYGTDEPTWAARA